MHSLKILEKSKFVYDKWIDIILWVTIIIIPIAILPIDVSDIFDSIKGPLLVLSGLTLSILLVLRGNWDNSWIVRLLFIYLGLILLSSIFAFDPLLAILGATPSGGGRFEGFVTFLIYGILFYSAKNYLIITQRKLIISFSFLSLVAVYSIFQYYELDPLVIYKKFRPLPFSTIGNQNFLASLMVMLSALNLGLFMYFRKWYYGAFMLLFFASLLISQTRGCWIAFGALLSCIFIYLLLFSRKDIIYYFASLTMFFIVAWFLNLSNHDKLLNRSSTIKREITTKSEYAGSGRMKIYEITLDVIKDHPFLGSGPENLKKAIVTEQKKEFDKYHKVKNNFIDKAHNEYMHIAAVSGIPALFAYLFLLFLIFFSNFKKRYEKLNLDVIFGFVILGYLTQALFNISVIAVAPVFWVFLGYLAQKTKGVY